MGCSCSKGRALARMAGLYSNATTTGLFVPVAGPVDLRSANQVAVRSEVVGVTSSNLAWKPAVRYAGESGAESARWSTFRNVPHGRCRDAWA